jgi:predicted DNA-binding antitoxin AbrB/MazE fold protein
MHQVVTATYQDGMLHPAHKLPLVNQQRVLIVVVPLPQAAAQHDPVRVAMLKERAAEWLSQQPSQSVRPPLSLSPSQQQDLDSGFDAALSEVRARSGRYSEAEIVSEIAAALAEIRATPPNASPELEADLAAILAEWA